MQISKESLISKYGIDLKPGKYKVYAIGDVYRIFTVKDDTEGCVLLGQAINAAGITGGTSRPAVEQVKKIVKQARDFHRVVQLEILNITEVA